MSGKAAELVREANAFVAPSPLSVLEAAIAEGPFPMRLSFQDYLGLKSASPREMLMVLERLCALSDAMRGVHVLMLNGLPGLRGVECMRALVRLLVLNPQIFSLNLGERVQQALTASEYDILASAVEAGCTGLALCWIEHNPERLRNAVNENRRRLQEQAFDIYKLTGHAATVWARIPWRDTEYRQRLVASCSGLSDYGALGQHHVTGLKVWTEEDLRKRRSEFKSGHKKRKK